MMKIKFLAILLMAGGSLFAGTHFFVWVGVGAPGYGYYRAAPPPPPVVAYVPPGPGPNYAWVGGYWYPAGPLYAWRAGYWAPRPYPHAYWVGPRYYGHRYYRGYWRR